MLVNKPGSCEMSMPDDDQHQLKLQRVRSTDVGQLVVTASNQFGSDLCTLQLASAGQTRSAAQLQSSELYTELWQQKMPAKRGYL